MNVDIDLFFQAANSLITIFCGVFILYLVSKGKLERHIFYYGWSVGFILYGAEILSRTFYASGSLTTIATLIAFILFQFSTLALDPRKDIILLFLPIFSLLLLIPIFSYLGIMQYGEFVRSLFSLFAYLPVAFLLIIHRRLFGNCVDKLIMGWLLLFLVNVLLPNGGAAVDALAIFCKIIILFGVVSYDFAIVVQKIRSELALHVSSPVKDFREEGGLKLIMFESGREHSLKAVSEWMKREIDENIKRNIEMSIVVLQDVIPYSTLMQVAWRKPELIHIFVLSQNSTGFKEFTTLRHGITELGATINEIARKHAENKSKGVIILIDLSILIHTFGANEAYNLLLNKMGLLRSSGVSLIAVFHPETHEEQVVALFKTIADNIIQV